MSGRCLLKVLDGRAREGESRDNSCVPPTRFANVGG
jgi:hypothetical protein